MSKTFFNSEGLSSSVIKILLDVGGNYAIARKRRRWRQQDVAQRIHCTRQTVAKIERGDPCVAMGVWINYAHVLGLDGTFSQICHPDKDTMGQWLDVESRSHLQRVREKMEKELDF